MFKTSGLFSIGLLLTTQTLFAAPSQLPLVKGLIRSITADRSFTMIRHEEIPNLNMAAMTMNFKAIDPHMLATFKEGDNILFTADKINGRLTLMSIKKQ